MGKPREFTTLPARAIADSRLTGLDLRVLAAIAIHDGMSLVKGTGPGCYAKLTTLATLVRTDVSNFSKSVSRLVGFDYVVREPQQMDKRRYTLRVIYGDDDSWRVDQQSAPEKLGEETNDWPENVGEPANFPPEIVGEADHENGSISKENCEHYISLNEEIDFEESREINSPKGRASPEGETPIGVFYDQNTGTIGLSKNGAEARLGRVSLLPHLPKSFETLAPGAQVSKIEDAFNAIERDAEAMESRERELFAEVLFKVSEDFPDHPTGQQAMRLWEEIALW